MEWVMRAIVAPNGVPYLQFESLPDRGLQHGVLTRQGGVSPAPWESLNFSISVGDERARVVQNNQRAHEAIGVDPAHTIDRYIAHTARIWHIGAEQLGQTAPLADGFVTTSKAVVLALTFADCQPILAYDPVAQVLGLAHAGWRGTVGGIAGALVAAMVQCGSRPADIYAALGPAIGVCCYEVGNEVAAHAKTWQDGAAWLAAGTGERPHFNLNAANTAQLRHAGVQRVECADICTACHTDRFFSYRAEKPVTGRFGVIASLV
jgi:YfiH family protein